MKIIKIEPDLLEIGIINMSKEELVMLIKHKWVYIGPVYLAITDNQFSAWAYAEDSSKEAIMKAYCNSLQCDIEVALRLYSGEEEGEQ